MTKTARSFLTVALAGILACSGGTLTAAQSQQPTPGPLFNAVPPAQGIAATRKLLTQITGQRDRVMKLGERAKAFSEGANSIAFEPGKDPATEVHSRVQDLTKDIAAARTEVEALTAKARTLLIQMPADPGVLQDAQSLSLVSTMLATLAEQEVQKHCEEAADKLEKSFEKVDKTVGARARKGVEAAKALVDATGLLKTTTEEVVKVAKGETSPMVVAIRLQVMGLAPRLYTIDPGTKAQKVTELYNLQTGLATETGEKLLRALTAPGARVSPQKLHRLTQLAAEAADIGKDNAYKAFPEKAQAVMNQAFDLAAMPLKSGETALDLGGDATLGSRLEPIRAKARQDIERLAGDTRAAAVLESDRLSRMARAMDTLSFQGTTPLLPPDLVTIVKTVPEKALTDRQWQTLIESFPMGKSLWAMRIDRLWRQGVTGEGVKVAILDTGVDAAHPDLAPGAVALEKNLTYHRYTDESKPETFGKSDPRGEHGTHVASTIHAIAPGAHILNIKILDEEAKNIPQGFMADQPTVITRIVDGLDAALQAGAHIVSLSLGLPGSQVALRDADVVTRKVEELAAKGVIVIVAAGNEGNGEGRRPGYIDRAVTVGTADYFGRLADFSGRASTIDLTNVKAYDKPDIVAYGVDVRAAKFHEDSDYASGKDSDLHVEMSGTSMATPHVSGVAALLAQAAVQNGKRLDEKSLKALFAAGATEISGSYYWGVGAGLIDPVKAYAALTRPQHQGGEGVAR